MRSNWLQLNASKIEVLWYASVRRQSQLPSDPLAVGSNLALFVSCMRDLGIFINADLTMRIQVTQTRSKCFAAFRQLRSIRQSLSIFVLHGWSSKLVIRTAFSHYCADYTGFGCQNVFRSGRQCWCIAASTALHLTTWPQIFSVCHTLTHVNDCALWLHQRCSFHALCILPLATAPFQRLWHRSETVAWVGSIISIVASFSQQTENRTFCLILQSWLTTSHCTDYYYMTSLFRLIVTCPCSLNLTPC